MRVPFIESIAISVASPVRRLGVALAAVVTLLNLGACSQPGAYEFAPPCPRTGIVADAADIVSFRPTASGPSQDLTDMIVTGRITGLRGACSREDNGRERVKVTVLVQLTRGPALASRTVSVPYFLSVSNGDTILAKDPQTATVEFPPNVDRVQFTSAPITLSLPTTKDKSGASFDVLAGFQLTPDELAYNRSKGMH
ncbi:MAG TPA: hypothetical protein VJY39_23660 [Acidisphaera sp.]|nr:hypothetical protein [Acidisphaera sp.]